jgi:hypothetical protein
MASSPKQYPACGGYRHGNTDEDSNRNELQDEEAVTRWSSTFQGSEAAEGHRREYAGHEHGKARCRCEKKSAQDSHTYCSRVTRIHSSI